MHLTISKRFDFESSHRLAVSGWSDQQNLSFYGREGASPHGHGHNFAAHLVFEGPVEESTGMMINVVVIKDKVKAMIDERYDHKYINGDTPPFDVVVPTPENIARYLLNDASPLFEGMSASPVICHLSESPISEATAYADGRLERHLWIDFSAARRTFSPHLTDEENERLFGTAASPSGHGHHYRLRVTLAGDISDEHGMIMSEAEARTVLAEFRDRFDHRNLSQDFGDFSAMPMTTEMLTRYFYQYLKYKLPVSRVKLYENDRFFVEYAGGESMRMAVTSDFHAAHRLHSSQISDDENIAAYGKCNNPWGHGHQYRTECTIDGNLDEETGTVFNLADLNKTVIQTTEAWNYKHLNLDTDDFRDRTSTGENIMQVLWSKLEPALGDRLWRLRLWETENNRFSLRRAVTPRMKEEAM